jgi:hypothetical protein
MPNMMIYKYPLEILDYPEVVLPKGAKILTIQVQNGNPWIWALVDTSINEYESRRLRIVGTGHPFEDFDDWEDYITTIQLMEGRLVFHIFGEER